MKGDSTRPNAQRLRGLLAKRLCLWSLLFIYLFPISVHGQLPDFHLQFYDYAVGIRSGNIETMARDARGFLWILYPRSVQRFDGRRIVTFGGLADVRRLYCDHHGGVWVSSGYRSYRFDDVGQKFDSIPLPQWDDTQAVGAIFSLPDSSVCINTTRGFFIWEPGKGFTKQLTVPGLKQGFRTRFFGITGHSLFFGHHDKLFRYDIVRQKLDSLPGMDVFRIFPMHADSAIVASWGLRAYWYNFARGTVHEVKLPPEVQQNSRNAIGIRCMDTLSSGLFVLGTRLGMLAYDAARGTFRKLQVYHKGRPLNTADYANELFSDREGSLWLSTLDGIARVPVAGQNFGLIKVPDAAGNATPGIDNIRHITGDGRGNLWMATGSGFVQWDRAGDKWKVHLSQDDRTDGLSFPSVRGIGWDGRYVLLAPANRGIWLFDPATSKYRRPVYDNDTTRQLSEQDFFDAVCTLQNGHHVFTGRDALYLMDGKTYRLQQIHSPASAENTGYAFQGRDGRVWVTTNSGLHVFDGDMQYQGAASLPAGRPFISASFMMSDNRLLFAMEQGLYTAKVREGNILVEKFTDRFDNKFINSIFIDATGVIWAASEDGIYR
ncbi:MAG TPA: hypothetical protein VK907_14535, partial [Phnomibacter sp.]|nr:hypothetical protein [Phnomibacter sp.]